MTCFLLPDTMFRANSATKAIMEEVRAGRPPSFNSPLERKSVYDGERVGLSNLPGRMARNDATGPSRDETVNQAWDNADMVYDFYRDVFGREGIDGKGAQLVSTVHFARGFDNAFWTGRQMVYGDGSGKVLKVGAAVTDLAIAAHEITHGVIASSAGLFYKDQSGALNESWADALAVTADQYWSGDPVDQGTFLIGEGVLGDSVKGYAVRDLKNPGKANAKDIQVANMKDFRLLPRTIDNGGVHVNSGIPSKAFYLAAMAVGGNLWETVGKVWYLSLLRMAPGTSFAEAAKITHLVARETLGDDNAKHVLNAWKAVGVR